MEKVYKYDNALIYILGLDTYDQDSFRKATEEFLKKVVNGGTKNEYTNTSKNFRKE